MLGKFLGISVSLKPMVPKNDRGRKIESSGKHAISVHDMSLYRLGIPRSPPFGFSKNIERNLALAQIVKRSGKKERPTFVVREFTDRTREQPHAKRVQVMRIRGATIYSQWSKKPTESFFVVVFHPRLNTSIKKTLFHSMPFVHARPLSEDLAQSSRNSPDCH